MPAAALAVEQGVIGDWAADGSKNVAVPDSAAANASGAGRRVPRARRRGVPGERRHAHRPARGPRDVGRPECDVCVVGAGGGGLNAAARAAELGADVICVEALGLHGGNAQSAGMCGILGGYSGQNKKHFAFPSYPFDAQALTDWANGRVPLRGRPETHLQDCQRRRQKPGLDGRLRRALAFGRGAGVRGAEERHARPPRAEDEGRHRRHVRLRSEKRRALQVPVPGNGAGARRFGAHRGPGGARGFRPRGVHPRQGRRHPDGRRLLQQQGAAGEVHPHGGHGLRVKLPGGRRNGRVLPHGPGRGRRRVGVQQLGQLRRRR